MKRIVSAPRLLEGLTAVLLAAGLLWLSLTRVYLYYVTPRTLPFLYFGAVALLAIGVHNFRRLFEASHVRRYTHTLALLIPLVLLAASVTQQNLWAAPLLPSADAQYGEQALAAEPYTMRMPVYAGRELHGYDPAQQTLTIAQEETYFWLSEIYNDPAPFLNVTVRTMGKVLKDERYFAADGFSPTRELMTCCVADLYTVGFKCQYADTASLAEGDWVSVTGKLAMVDLEEYQELRLIVDTVTPSAPPETPYVYSY
jgi:putative membrane protein